MKNRSVISVIIFTLITCGIYGIYWTYVVAEELNQKETTEKPLLNYILAIILGIVTCGIYMIYWMYKFYVKLDKVLNTTNAVLYLILTILGLEIVSMALVQDAINNTKVEE